LVPYGFLFFSRRDASMSRLYSLGTWSFGSLAIALALLIPLVIPEGVLADAGGYCGSQCDSYCYAQCGSDPSCYSDCLGGCTELCCLNACGSDQNCQSSCCQEACGGDQNCQQNCGSDPEKCPIKFVNKMPMGCENPGGQCMIFSKKGTCNPPKTVPNGCSCYES
jgi:hypothetical protein